MCHYKGAKPIFWGFIFTLCLLSHPGWIDAQGSGSGSSHFQISKDNAGDLQPVWTYPLEGGTGFGHKLLFDDKQNLLYFTQTNRVLALDPSIGILVWEYLPNRNAVNSEGVQSSIICRKSGKFYLRTEEGRSQILYEDGDITLSPSQEWKNDEGCEPGATDSRDMLKTEGLIFVTEGSEFQAKDAESQKTLYSFDLGTTRISGPITYTIDGKQYVVQHGGFVHGTEATGMERSISMNDFLVSFGLSE